MGFLGTIIWIFIFIILISAVFFYFQTSNITGNVISEEKEVNTSSNQTIMKTERPLERIIRPNQKNSAP